MSVREDRNGSSFGVLVVALGALHGGTGCALGSDDLSETAPELGSEKSAIYNGALNCGPGTPGAGTAACFPELGTAVVLEHLVSGTWTQNCSARLIRPRWIATAWHCVTDGFGVENYATPPYAASTLRFCVRRNDVTPRSWSNKVCSNVVTNGVLRASEVMTDMALVHLSDGALATEIAKTTPPMGPIDPFTHWAHTSTGNDIVLAGYGYSDPDQAENPFDLTWAYGSMYNESVQANHNLSEPPSWSWWTNNWQPETLQPDTTSAFGDSGGSAFARKTWPWSTLGINSMSPQFGGFGLLASAYDFREFVGQTIASFLPGTSYLLNFGSSSHLSTNLASKSPANDTTSTWSVTSGYLQQSANAPRSMRLMTGTSSAPDHVFDNFQAEVSVTNPTGSNQSGLAFRWVDDSHYYFATLSESQDYFRLVRRDGSSDKLLAQAVWTGDEATSMVIKVQVLMDRINAQLLVKSSGAVVATLTANDSRFPIGRVGVLQDSNAGARFDDFKVSARTDGYDIPSVMENISGISAWSGWYDIDNATSGSGDNETITAINAAGPDVCSGSAPYAVEARIVGQSTPLGSFSGRNATLSPQAGLNCTNQTGNSCQDYAVRFLCP